MSGGDLSGTLGEDSSLGQEGELPTLLVEGNLSEGSLIAVRIAQDDGHDPAALRSRFASRLAGSPQGWQASDTEGSRLLPDLLLLRAQLAFLGRLLSRFLGYLLQHGRLER